MAWIPPAHSDGERRLRTGSAHRGPVRKSTAPRGAPSSGGEGFGARGRRARGMAAIAEWRSLHASCATSAGSSFQRRKSVIQCAHEVAAWRESVDTSSSVGRGPSPCNACEETPRADVHELLIAASWGRALRPVEALEAFRCLLRKWGLHRASSRSSLKERGGASGLFSLVGWSVCLRASRRSGSAPILPRQCHAMRREDRCRRVLGEGCHAREAAERQRGGTSSRARKKSRLPHGCPAGR